MLANLDEGVRVPDLDPHTIVHRRCRGLYRLAVQSRPLERKTDPYLAPVRPAIARRKVTEDAVVDRIALGANVDGLDDFDRRIRLDRYVAWIPQDALVRVRHGRRERQE